MKILIGKTFGLGNSVMSIPMLKAIRAAQPKATIDVLIGSTGDDAGAAEVFSMYKMFYGGIDMIYVDQVPPHVSHDIAIMSIPFDGRWKNGVHFSAGVVMDGRTRPDPNTSGLVSWKKHEIEYQMENAYDLGYPEDLGRPSTNFYPRRRWRELNSEKTRYVYFGTGYKKDLSGFWKIKDWGIANFVDLANLIVQSYEDVDIVVTCGYSEWDEISRIRYECVDPGRISVMASDFRTGLLSLERCDLYVGNDTGMMHAAASLEIPCISLFFMDNAYIKNRPDGTSHTVIEDLSHRVSPEEVFEHVKRHL